MKSGSAFFEGIADLSEQSDGRSLSAGLPAERERNDQYVRILPAGEYGSVPLEF